MRVGRAIQPSVHGGHAPEHFEFVVLDVAGQRWALPLEAVERVLAMVAIAELPGSPAGVIGAVNVHGEPVPVLDLDVRSGRPPRERGPRGRLVLARTATRRVALPVDDVLGVVTVARDALGAAPESVPAPVAGLAALPDGVLAVYDVDGLITAEEERAVSAALA